MIVHHVLNHQVYTALVPHNMALACAGLVHFAGSQVVAQMKKTANIATFALMVNSKLGERPKLSGCAWASQCRSPRRQGFARTKRIAIPICLHSGRTKQ